MKPALTLGRIPVKNLRSHPVRGLILMLLIMVQAACVFGGLTLLQSMRTEMARAEARLGADVLLYPSAAMSRISGDSLLMQGTPVEVWKDRSMLSRLEDCDGIGRTACQLYLQDTTGDEPVWITGYDPEEDFVISPWLAEGTALPVPEGTVLAGAEVRAENGCVTLFGEAWPVSGRLAETGSELDEMVFADLSTLKSLIRSAEKAGITKYSGLNPETDFTVALIRVSDGSDIDSVSNWLNVYIRKTKAVRSEETLSDTSRGIRGQMGLTAGIGAGAWVILLAALGIAGSIMMKERKKELFVWHVIGASRAVINRIMLEEALLLYGAGALAGIGVGALVTGMAFGASFSPAFALLTLILSILTGCISTMLSVRRATRSLNGQMLLTV